jgi:glycosyltransferase involved in cell wall biosynthesis
MITGDRSLAEGKRGAFYNTLEEFHKYWQRIDVICPKISDKRQEVKEIFGNVFIHASSWPLILQPYWILKKGWEIYRVHKTDLMTVHEYPPFYNGLGARLLWNKTHLPYVLEIHHIPGYPRAANLKEKFYAWLMRIFIKYDSSVAKAVRVVNQKQVPEFLINTGVPKEKIVYIPSFYIDLEVFRPFNSPKKYDLIFVGRLAKNKGMDLLLEAVKKLSASAIIVGDGPLKENLKLKIENLKLHDNVVFHGWAKDSTEVAKLINESKILVMSSYNEGGPRIVLEAMACGVPVLATPVGIVPDIIEDGRSGRIIDWSMEDIARKAGELLRNRTEYEKYQYAGLEITKRFEKKKAIQNYAEKLHDLI